MEANIVSAKNILKQQIDDFNKNENTIISNLINLRIDSNILSTCISEYNKANFMIQELRYRFDVLSYKIIFIKKEKESLNTKIEDINRYIVSLQ